MRRESAALRRESLLRHALFGFPPEHCRGIVRGIDAAPDDLRTRDVGERTERAQRCRDRPAGRRDAVEPGRDRPDAAGRDRAEELERQVDVVRLDPFDVGPAAPQPVTVTGVSETLVWEDQFDGQGLPDPSRWDYEVGLIRNNERQYYTRGRSANARVQDGTLVIEAHKEAYEGAGYTSASLTSRANWTYGRIEVRAMLPKGRGTWPAIWTLGANIRDVGWPMCGEIDIMEHVGFPANTNITSGALHGPGYSGGGNIGGQLVQSQAVNLNYHVYAIEWSPDDVKWFVDSNNFLTVTRDQVQTRGQWVYDHPFFILLNVAVGGAWPGYPDGTSQFPQRMYVDYVRVYQ